MTQRVAVDDFLAQKTLALAGMSSSGKGFGHTIYRELVAKGYEILPIHPEAAQVGGVATHAGLGEVADRIGGLIICTSPAQTEKLVDEALQAGVSRIWMQQGAESAEAVRTCTAGGIDLVHGECILMFAEPAGFIHRFHRCLWGLLGKLPR